MSMDIEYELLHKLDTLGTHDHDELLSQFQSIVGKNLSPSSCSFYLEMGNWNLQRAICAYYDVNSSIHLPSFVVVAESMHTDTLSVRPNEIFNKCWKLRNTGNTAWPHNLKLKHMRGHLFTGAQHCSLPSVEPGETIDISVMLEAPAYDGAYTATWRLMTLQGTLCGESLQICATVDRNGSISTLTSQMRHLNQMEDETTRLNSNPSQIVNNDIECVDMDDS